MKTIKKALDILEIFFNGSEDGLSISELADITGQNISTVHGILAEMSAHGFIRQKEKRGKYFLGSKFLSFSGAVSKIFGTIDIVRPYIEMMSKELDETVNMAVLNGDNVINISIIHSTHKLRVVADDKVGIPLYCSATGKLFLASKSTHDFEQYLGTQQLIQYTPNTITDVNKLKRQMRKIRKDGISYDNEEFEVGIRNVAAPVKDFRSDTVVAIGVLGPSVRLSVSRMRAIAPTVIKYANEVSLVMGYKQ